jgi:predicted SnoaL-like aldol condensation-catalyzing enzyme
MTETVHANMSVLAKLNFQDLDVCRDLFADNFVWHYFNPRLPELEGDHLGIEGLKSFFAKLNERSKSSFQRKLIDARPVGDELVITQVCNRMDLDGNTIEVDAVVIWRIVDSKISEAWDIPAVNTVRTIQKKIGAGG